MIKYSICTTTYNIAPRIEKSLNSIIKFVDEREWEIIVVDSKSTDGTREILEKYRNKFPNFTIIDKKCKRGKGRQIAYLHSRGKYIIVVDLDTIYLPSWIKLLNAYENSDLNNRVALQAPYFGVYPRHLLEKVGGWRNLQLGEDFDLWWRLIKINAFRWTPILVGENWEMDEPERRQVKNMFSVIWRKFIAEKDRFISRSEYSIRSRLQEIKMWATKKTYYLFWIPAVTLSWIVSRFYFPEKRDPNRVKELWEKCMIDFPDIEGRRNTEFIHFPRNW